MRAGTVRVWLSIGAAYGIVAGVALVLAALSEEASAIVSRLVFFGAEGEGGPVTVGVRQGIAVSGALTAGIGAIAWCLRPGATPEPAADRRAGKALAVGLILWFVLDSTLSVLLGAGANVVGNVSFMIALLPPSLAMARG